MLQLILEPILGLLFYGVGYIIGFVPVLLGTLGSVEPGPLDRIADRSFYRSTGMKWWHLTYVDKGRRYMPAEGVALIGWGVIASVVGLAWLLFKMVG